MNSSDAIGQQVKRLEDFREALWIEARPCPVEADNISPMLCTIGRADCFSLRPEDIELATADPVGFVSDRLKIPRVIVEQWADWVESECPCLAFNKKGMPCGGHILSAPYVSPSDFDPDSTPYCQRHKDRKSRNAPRRISAAKSLTNVGSVYLLKAIGTPRYKIGKTTRLDRRRIDLARQSPYPLELIALIRSNNIHSTEAELLARFCPFRVHGEWFELPPSAVAEICAMQGEG